MCDGEVLPPSAPFARGCKARASLPVSRTSSQTRERPLGVLYLQYGEEMRQVRMPAEICSQDSVRALFVTAFPHQLTMKMLQSPNMAIYIKDTSRNVYYDLEDLRNITPYSCLKAYHKDPAQVFNRHARPANAEGRISKEMLYGNHSPIHTRSPLHSLQGSMSPPTVRSMPSSPSRMAYGGGKAGRVVVNPGSITLPRQRLSAGGQSSGVYSSSSAILERRDVRPDEHAGNSKCVALVLRGDGGEAHPESYTSSLLDAGGPVSAPPSLAAELMVDSGVPGIPRGLQQYRASIKPLMGHGESMEHQTSSLHRQRNRIYGDSHPPPLAATTPPSSPHRGSEVRMIGRQVVGGVGVVSPERTSPIRRSFQRDGTGATVEVGGRHRGSSSSASSVFVDSPLGQQEVRYPSPVTASDAHSERMKAMEEQIASLAGLVHHALSMGSDVPGLKDTVRENTGNKGHDSRLAVPSETQNLGSPPLLALQAPPTGSCMQQSLMMAKRDVCELRLQLSQLRCLQLSNLESVSSMLRMAGQELVAQMHDRLTQCEEALYRQRSEMEEDRIRYLTAEDEVLTQLSELEEYVGRLQGSACSGGQMSVTLREVEAGAVSLRSVGEALAFLKAEFPGLQLKMRSVLTLEVEAVRFLKEEPQKIDTMLKRVRALTEALSHLRRCVSESNPPASVAHVEPLKVLKVDQRSPKIQSPQGSPKPQPRSSVRQPAEGSSANPAPSASIKSASASVVHPPHCHPQTSAHGRKSPAVSKSTDTPQDSRSMDQNQPGTRQPQSSDSSHTMQNTPSVQDVHVVLRKPSPGLDQAPTVLRSEQNTHQDPALKAVDCPPPTSPRIDGSSRPKVDKPPRSSVDRDRRPNLDRDSDSPPLPPAPRRTPAVGSGDIIHKPPVGPQDDANKPGQPAEVQPKVQECDHPAAAILPPTTAVLAHREDEEDHKLMKEQQVSAGASDQDLLQLKEKVRTPDISSDMSCDLRSAGQLAAAVSSQHGAERRPVGGGEVTSFNCAVVKKVELCFQTGPGSGFPSYSKQIKTDGGPEVHRTTAKKTGLVLAENMPVPEPEPDCKRNKSLNSDVDQKLFPPVLKPPCLLRSPRPSSKQQDQQNQVQVSRVHQNEVQVCRARQSQEEEGSLSPAFWDDEEPPPPPPLLFRFIRGVSRSDTRTQSEGEDHCRRLVSVEHEDSDAAGSEPVDLVLLEPVNIQLAYKHLETIFECEEDLDVSRSPDGVIDDDDEGVKRTDEDQNLTGVSRNHQDQGPSVPDDQNQTDLFLKPDSKKKFTFKFPKTKLAAIRQMIRSGAGKTGKKIPQMIMCEEDPASSTRVEVLCRNTLDSIGSLEESIRQLEISVDAMSTSTDPSRPHSFSRSQLKGKARPERERSPSKRPAPQVLKGPNPPQSKKSKPQPQRSSGKTSARKQTSRTVVQRSHTKTRPPTGDTPERKTEEQQQLSKQPRHV